MSSPNWPILLSDGELELRPLRLRDRKKWNRVRNHNRDWLRQWEATLPIVTSGPSATIGQHELPSFFAMIRIFNREARHGRSYSFVIWKGDALIGQITMGGVIYGAMRGAHIGYWIDCDHANRGFTTQAVGILTRFGFDQLGLHRIEINLRPENAPSRRVAEKAGYILEGSRARYLHIDGQWRDHITFVKENASVE
jgi:ribosomal-protein-alanine N-acetyltransferase